MKTDEKFRMTKDVQERCSGLIVDELMMRSGTDNLFPVHEMADFISTFSSHDLEEKHIRGLIPKVKRRVYQVYGLMVCNKRKLGYFVSGEEDDVREELRKSAKRCCGHIGSVFIANHYLVENGLKLDPEKNLDDEILDLLDNINLSSKVDSYGNSDKLSEEVAPEPVTDPLVKE